MSKLESLVPPQELCKLIPAGSFDDAALAWIHADVVGFVCRTSGCEQVAGKEWQLIRSNASRVIRARKRGEEIFPAPAASDIMADLNNDYQRPCIVFRGYWICNVTNIFGDEIAEMDNDSHAAAALKLWLKLKGVEAWQAPGVCAGGAGGRHYEMGK